MANFGISKPYIAKYGWDSSEKDYNYSEGMSMGRSVSTSVTPNYNESSLYADNIQAEYVNEFTNASLTMGVDRIPVQAGELLFGHQTDESGVETSAGNDSGNYVGYGFVTAEMVENVKKYRACILTKVKMVEGEESYTTKGDSITFATPSLSGQAMADDNNVWRIKSGYYTSEAQAEAWIKEKFGIA